MCLSYAVSAFRWFKLGNASSLTKGHRNLQVTFTFTYQFLLKVYVKDVTTVRAVTGFFVWHSSTLIKLTLFWNEKTIKQINNVLCRLPLSFIQRVGSGPSLWRCRKNHSRFTCSKWVLFKHWLCSITTKDCDRILICLQYYLENQIIRFYPHGN